MERRMVLAKKMAEARRWGNKVEKYTGNGGEVETRRTHKKGAQRRLLNCIH